MIYNADCTVWHKTNNGYVTLYYPCWWQDTEAVNISKTGSTNVDSVFVHLPIDADVAKQDYIIKGIYDFQAESPSELLKVYKALKITTVSRKFYGNVNMRHTEVTAR